MKSNPSRRTNTVLAVVVGLSLHCSCGHADDWGCYDSKPGHPTAMERAAFVTEVSALSLDAEVNHGVPAPALAAMAIQESGYGFTRTALFANNLFGFKWTATGAGHFPTYELTCQPNDDPGKLYVKFATRREAMEFVANRLAISRYYRSATATFRKALENGEPREEAVITWVKSIADSYNVHPEEYTLAVVRVMNDPIAPSDRRSAERTLFNLIPNTAAKAEADDLEKRTDLIERMAKTVGGGRYMSSPACFAGQSPATSKCCASLDSSDALFQSILAPYKDFRTANSDHEGIQYCRYSDGGLDTEVIVLNPTPKRVAQWTISACQKALAKSMTDCATWVWKNILSLSGTQFAIAGAVIEPRDSPCSPLAEPGQSVGYIFRDGVAVRLTGFHVCDVDKRRLGRHPSPYFDVAIENSAVPGKCRITMLDAGSYARYFNAAKPALKPDESGTVPWLRLVREQHMDALRSESHAWLDRIVDVELPRSLRSEKTPSQ
jgi:hypothetical protein